jgi:hypothetical protein
LYSDPEEPPLKHQYHMNGINGMNISTTPNNTAFDSIVLNPSVFQY